MVKLTTFMYLPTFFNKAKVVVKNVGIISKVILCEGIYLLLCLTNQVIKMYPRSCILFTICINTSTKQVSPQQSVINF